uniref:Tail protein n=1 Tax=viral metagenome TaxID=1070528 RepID=A0A6M3LZI6_9ZZZZ
MKSASTSDRTEYILYDIVNGSRSKPLAQLDYWDGTEWKPLDDIKSLSFSQSNQQRRYGSITLVPPANEMSCAIDNKEEKYSPDTGGLFDGVLIRNRLVRAAIGYQLNDTTTETYTHDPDITSGRVMYHTQVISDKIYNDITSASSFTALPGLTTSWNFYDGLNYDASTYSPEGYYLSSYIDFLVYKTETLQQLKVTATSTGIKVYYRASDVKDDLINNTTSFTYLGACSVGTKTFTLSDVTERWFQFCLVFDTGTWGTNYAENIQIVYTQSAEYFTQGEYLMDDPGFTSRLGDYSASFSARDYLKKALETEVSCPTYAVAVDCAQILRDVCDRAGIPHNDGAETIADTTYDVAIANDDNFQDEKAVDVFGEVMFYLNGKNTAYRLEMVEGNLTLYTVDETPTEADWQLHYIYNLISLDKRYVSNKLLQRVTVLTKDHTVDPESQLATDTYTEELTDEELTWSNDSMYLRIETSGNGTFVLKSIDLNGKKIVFDVEYESTATEIDLDVTVYGDEHRAGFTGYFGEAQKQVNATNVEGFTNKIINRLCQSDAECTDIAEGLIAKYGDPKFQLTATIPCNPLLEIGDKILVWEKYSNSKSIFIIDEIRIEYSADGASMMQTLILTDTGVDDTASFIWDKNGADAGASDRKLDVGTLWEQDLGVSVTEDTTDYSSTKMVRFA